ncbi:MAG: MerR family transcriptional regulator, partial [Actinomycetota bacterium]|nr:MerR family transcriptional regulator [Actinomycetota bacterium]
LRARGVDDLAHITLLSDGTTVYECTSSEEVVDLLRGGQGVFGIAVSGALRELVGSLAQLPGERADGAAIDETVTVTGDDELSQRRRQRTATA